MIFEDVLLAALSSGWFVKICPVDATAKREALKEAKQQSDFVRCACEPYMTGYALLIT